MKVGLQYPVSSAICSLVDYPLSSVKCSVGQCFWSTGQDKDLLVFFCVPEVAYPIPTHTLGYFIHPHHTRSELSYTSKHTHTIHPHHPKSELFYTPTLSQWYTHTVPEVICPIHSHSTRDGVSYIPTLFQK